MRILLSILFLLPTIAVIAQQPDEQYFAEQVVNKVIAFNAQSDSLTTLYKAAKEKQSPDTTMLQQQKMETVKKCFQVPQDFIKQYPSSALCLSALQMLAGENGPSPNAPVQLNDLEKLFQSLSKEVRTSPDGLQYEKQLKSWQWMVPLAQAAPLQQSISSKTAAQELTEAVGKKAVVKQLPLGSKQLSEEEVLQQAKAATLIVGMAYKLKGGTKTQVNPTTAYVIDEDGVCVTNYHVIQEYSSKDMYTNLFVMTSTGKAYPVTKVLAASQSDDLAIIQVDTKGDKLNALPIGKRAAEGTTVYVLGHPQKTFYQFTKGQVLQYANGELFGQQCFVMYISADFTIGSSGGPVVDSYGNVVGTVSRINPNGDGSVTKITIPEEVLEQLIVR